MIRPHEYVCPRGHNTLESTGDGELRCLHCALNKDVWSDDPTYTREEIHEAARPPKEPFGYIPSSVGKVGSRLNCHAKLLPFDRWEYDRAETGLAIAEYLDTLPEYRQTFKLRQVAPYVTGEELIKDVGEIDMGHSCSDQLWLSHKVQPVKNVTATKYVFLNPDYCHYEACGPPAPIEGERLRYNAMLYAGLGRIKPHVVERNLGIENIYDVDPYWDERREIGKRWMGNTLGVIKEWTGWSYSQIGRAYGMHHSTVSKYIRRHAELDEYPPDPSLTPRFGRRSRDPQVLWDEVPGETA